MGEFVRNSIRAITFTSGFIIRLFCWNLIRQIGIVIAVKQQKVHIVSYLGQTLSSQNAEGNILSSHFENKTPMPQPLSIFPTKPEREPLHVQRGDHARGVQSIPIRESMFTNIISESPHTLNNRTESPHKAGAAACKRKSGHRLHQNARCMHKQLRSGWSS